MSVRLSSHDYQKLLAHALENLPNEACGLLAGTEADDVRDIKEVYLLTNTDASNEHFTAANCSLGSMVKCSLEASVLVRR